MNLEPVALAAGYNPGWLHMMRLAPWRLANSYDAMLAILLACLWPAPTTTKGML